MHSAMQSLTRSILTAAIPTNGSGGVITHHGDRCWLPTAAEICPHTIITMIGCLCLNDHIYEATIVDILIKQLEKNRMSPYYWIDSCWNVPQMPTNSAVCQHLMTACYNYTLLRGARTCIPPYNPHQRAVIDRLPQAHGEYPSNHVDSISTLFR